MIVLATTGFLTSGWGAPGAIPAAAVPLQGRTDVGDRHGIPLATSELRLAVWPNAPRATLMDCRTLRVLGHFKVPWLELFMPTPCFRTLATAPAFAVRQWYWLHVKWADLPR